MYDTWRRNPSLPMGDVHASESHDATFCCPRGCGVGWMIADRRISAGLDRQDDDKLMREIRTGSTIAFEELYDRYSDRAYRVARSVCYDSARAEDAVQEAFTSVWRNPSTYRPDRGTVAAWLLSGVRYKAIDVARQHRAHARRHAPAELLEDQRATEDVAARVMSLDGAERLRTLLKKIPDSQREVITLAFFGQLTHGEIAAHLQLPPGTIKGRMRLGLQKLKTHIDQQAAERSPIKSPPASRPPDEKRTRTA